jgi:hypothetical protein
MLILYIIGFEQHNQNESRPSHTAGIQSVDKIDALPDAEKNLKARRQDGK